MSELSARTGEAVATLINAGSRAILSVPLHGVTGIIMGATFASWYLPGNAKWRPSVGMFFRSMALPVLIHGLFDTLAFSAGILGGTYQLIYIGNILLLIGSWFLAYRRIKEAIRDDYLPM